MKVYSYVTFYFLKLFVHSNLFFIFFFFYKLLEKIRIDSVHSNQISLQLLFNFVWQCNGAIIKYFG